MSSSPPAVLTFAASDPTGGAGVQADLLTIAAMGCHPVSVLTGLTVQDTHGVEALLPVEAAWVERQARRLLADIRVAAVKLGVLASRENVETIASLLAGMNAVPVVLDPVLASGRGDPLASSALMEALRGRIFPLTTLLTPNSIEARRLAGERDGAPLEQCARKLIEQGCGHVLVTGTHEPGEEVVNILYGRDGVVRADRWPRLEGSFHGSGCTLASAIAAALALGAPLADAVQQGEAFTWRALSRGFRPGGGQALPLREAGAR